MFASHDSLVLAVPHRLTDDESRENWEKYGNPDGPQAASFGIALPAWIVEKQNSVWVGGVETRLLSCDKQSLLSLSVQVLGLYLLVFIVVLPVIVVSTDLVFPTVAVLGLLSSLPPFLTHRGCGGIDPSSMATPMFCCRLHRSSSTSWPGQSHCQSNVRSELLPVMLPGYGGSYTLKFTHPHSQSIEYEQLISVSSLFHS